MSTGTPINPPISHNPVLFRANSGKETIVCETCRDSYGFHVPFRSIQHLRMIFGRTFHEIFHT